MTEMMECGRAANAKDKEGKPVCAICVGIDRRANVVAKNPPDLTGRSARCSYFESCKRSAPSSSELAFFEYQGAESHSAGYCKNCGFAERAHTDWSRVRGGNACGIYEARGDIGHDRFYCGCRGWD